SGQKPENNETERFEISEETARTIFELPTHCLDQEYPNKLGQVIGSASDLKSPKALRPIFYGCFDWHSAVHGYWSIVRLLKLYPQLDSGGKVRQLLNTHITEENLAVELAFFNDENNLGFERTYGWAWLFKLQEELRAWDDTDAQRWSAVHQSHVELLADRTGVYLSQLTYPYWTGQDYDSAFRLPLMYALEAAVGDMVLLKAMKTTSIRFYESDKNCELAYEPGGNDFL